MSGDAGTCMVCAGPLETLGPKDGGTYAACGACGAVQLVPVPDPAELDELYRSSYHDDGHYHQDPDEHLAQRRRVCEQVADVASAALPEGRAVVEIGAGWGNLGVVLAERGVPWVGLEPNPVLVEAGRSRGVDLREGDLAALEADAALRAEVGVLVSMAVYEHLARPGEELARMAALLPPGGAVVIQAPTAGIPRVGGRWARRLRPGRELPGFFGSLAAPWHVCLPTPRSLAVQAGRCGLEVRAVHVSRSGRAPDARRVLQAANEWVGRGGRALFGPGWPLAMAHVFVLGPEG